MIRVYCIAGKYKPEQYNSIKIYTGVKDQIYSNTKKPVYKKGDCYKKFENYLNREFYAEKPNERWCADFTYMILEDGRKRYNCSIIDLYDRSVAATRNSGQIDAALVIQTL
ncbi:hypothetical protein AALA98_09315 [Lachnospiraceae bacterium 45-W7]